MSALKVNDIGMVKDPSNSKDNDFFPMAQESLVCQGPSLWRLHDDARQDFSGRLTDPSQRPLRDNKNSHKKQTSMSLARFELTIPASTRPQTHALDRAATGMGKVNDLVVYICVTESYHLSG